MVAAMFSGIMTVSFLSPKRYICDDFVFSASSCSLALEASTSFLSLNEGLELYIPSAYLCPLPEEEYLADIPHEENMKRAPASRVMIFFIDFSPMFVNNISYLRNLI